MLLPGQVENWVVLTDLAKNGLGNLSLSSLKQVLHILQANYRCRLGVNYIINPPKSIWMLWSCIKPFLDSMTIDKIKITNASYSSEMMTMFNPYQVEERYGGKAPNLTYFWPPTIPDTPFAAEGKKIQLSTNDSYSRYNPIEIVIQEPANLKPRPSIRSPKMNSHNVSVASSEIEVAELPADGFARSDEENEENLVDFEFVSPFTRNKERNPTFLSSGMMSGKDLQKRLSIKFMGEAKAEKEEESLESSVDFEPDPTGQLLVSKPQEKVAESKLEQNEGVVLEEQGVYCGCARMDCGVVKQSCQVF
jgi:hypothetical protein